jgi:peptidoglycan/LPS O-acetylase OafA/YrhL
MVPLKSSHLRGLLVMLIDVVLVPGMIVVASFILAMANESAGWLRYRLPEVFFWIFLSTGIASPFLGIGTLVFAWMLRRRRVPAKDGKAESRIKVALIVVAVQSIVAPAVWTLVFSEVFFGEGGNR